MHDLVHDLAISLLGDKILDQSKQGNSEGSSCHYALLTDCSKPLGSCMASPATLSALHFLDCRWTELHGAAFGPAESLRVLDLSRCLIHKLPDSIGRLKQLRYLNAPRIRTRMVPKCITKLTNLRYLSLHGSCAILALPESIGEMEGLVHLDLSVCMGIKKLPESFGDLKSLEHVDFTNCKNITGISQCLARLTKLQYLNLSNCKNIGDLPRALGSLTQLQYLNLSDSSYVSGNKLAEAEILGSLNKLKYLNLSSSFNPHTIRLPESLGSLTGLKYLNLSHHFIMGKLPASFGNLMSLVHLDLSCCSSLRNVPATLSGLTKLQYLDAYGCSDFDAMEGLHKVLGNLSELRHLNLGCCIRWISYSHTEEINRLLGQIFTLTNLEYLNLSNNDNISSIPETLANLRKLHTLDLSWCGTLQRLPANTSEIDSLKFLHTIGCFGLDRSTLPQYKNTSKISQDFVVHADYGESPGWLKISRPETVKSAKELQIIKLVEKTDITRLALEWARDAKRILDDAEVLRELEPPQSVSKFGLKGYNSVSFPSWVLHIGAYLPGLTSIGMWDLPSCKNLPPLGQLPNLRLLEISRMDKIKKIDGDLYGGTRAFPRLEKFRVYSMNCLEEWNTAYSIDEDGLNESLFPCLSFVKIRCCPMLRFKPCPPRSIKDLLVYSSDKVMLSPWRNKGHVDASATIRLHVKCCEVPLERWSLLHHLPCLEHLWIKKCSNLTCSSTDFIGGFTSLQTLTVNGCESIVSLPEKLGYLTSLTKLEIFYCRSIKTLPDTIQKLSRLQHLEILGCPELVLWCTSKENKMKLAHIKDRFVWPQYEEAETGEECETDEESEKEDLESDPEET